MRDIKHVTHWGADRLGMTLASYIRFVRSSSRWIPDIGETEALRIEQTLLSHHPFIFAMWHGQFMLLPLMHIPGLPVQAMIARHGDTAVLGAMLNSFGMDLIRGAGAGGRKKDRGGMHAFRAAQEALTNGVTVAMTADVPPGPARRAGAGIVTLAKVSGRPIIPVAIASSRYQSFDTWSRFTINLPWSQCGVAIGEPIHVPADSDTTAQEHWRLAVEHGLNETTRLAYARAGAQDPIINRRADRRSPAMAAYRGMTQALEPAAPLLLNRRVAQGKEDVGRLGERRGHTTMQRPGGRLAWFHAASVGETVAIVPVLRALKARQPDLHLLLTTGTVTSARIAAERLTGIATHQFVPLDMPGPVARFLDHWQPSLGVFIESELWPNLILAARARGIPLALMNARMSDRSANGWRRRPTMAAKILDCFDIVLAQTDFLGRRFARLGARKVENIGNLKVDSPAPPVDAAALADLRTAIGGRLAFVAASTHPGEEALVVQARMRLAQAMPDPLAIIVPRHPHRGPELLDQFRQSGVPVSLRSQNRLPVANDGVFIADTLGELGTFYASTPVAFIGGSLVPIGGHNPVEAIRLGAGVLTGPHRFNFNDLYEPLLAEEGARAVIDADGLAVALGDLIGGGAQLETMTRKARTTIDRMGGALEKTLRVLEALLPQPAGAHAP
jgi:3-deoxy-D-manno-octulosonic-acid transferase